MVAASPVHPDGGAIIGAAAWLEGLLHGPAATVLAALAIAAIGLSMFSGRIPVRRGLAVVLGCFILFGAPAIARGIVGAAAVAPDAYRNLPRPRADVENSAFKAARLGTQ